MKLCEILLNFQISKKEKQLSFTSFSEDLAMIVFMLLDLYLSNKDGAVSSVLAVKAQQLAELPNGKALIVELSKRIERYYELDLNWLLGTRSE